MLTNDKPIIKQSQSPIDPRETFFIDFMEYTLNHGKADFAQSWMDREGALYNHKWKHTDTIFLKNGKNIS